MPRAASAFVICVIALLMAESFVPYFFFSSPLCVTMILVGMPTAPLQLRDHVVEHSRDRRIARLRRVPFVLPATPVGAARARVRTHRAEIDVTHVRDAD